MGRRHVGPRQVKHQRTIQGKIYVPVVLKVIKSDSDGPRLFEMVRYDETVHLQGGEHFWIVYGPEELARRVS